ncbi:WSSV422 [White spot syndrome virus]|uniref:WSSV422 n=1 Tax=White spot syndrome virus TaxID=342409 RepID=A0A2I6SCA9_9VIRU|nr:WSSV422 [White spot syndrome virus]
MSRIFIFIREGDFSRRKCRPEYIAANKLLITELIKRAEKCFYTVELLQAEFMEMCKMDKDFCTRQGFKIYCGG